MSFKTLLTNKGAELIVLSKANKRPIKLTYLAVGDGEGEPSRDQTSLKNEKFRVGVSAILQDPKNANYLIVEAVIPPSEGGFYVKEAGIFTDENDLFAVASMPHTYKPNLDEGSAKELKIRFVIEVSSSEHITLTVNNDISSVSREFVVFELSKKADKIDTYTKTQCNEKFAGKYVETDKADKKDTYTKKEVDALIPQIPNQIDAYTKTKTNELLELKADKNKTYNKQEVDEMLAKKYDKSRVYNKNEIDEMLRGLGGGNSLNLTNDSAFLDALIFG